MKLCILAPKPDEIKYSTKRLIEEAKKDFRVTLVPLVDVKLSIGKDMDATYEKQSLKKFDYILPRIDSKRAQIGYPVLRFLDHIGVRKPYPAETVLLAHNKWLTLEQLARYGVPVPETYLTSSKESALRAMNKLKLPLVIKLLGGFGGEGVLMVDSKEAFQSVVATMKSLKQEILIERFMESSGEDIRGIIAGEEIIASFKRIAAQGEKKANIHLGGRSISFKLTPEMEEIVRKSAEATKTKLCAVDMLSTNEGVKAIEVNINFGLQGIEKTTNINVARRIIEFVKSELKR
ncbi:MAG: RimK family alpha-L-glutamate ligase [Candidatus Aenigmarchaeota archaeon]|nr:RimK family alpha-L-glutamate ligase [Candidatus Aenigmarchaeota archaeon]